ncbi:MAG: hypothetical protein FWC43_05680 [Planctomycetaceae bacterium]|nr:hypothetical protein [Planctomycetaceae bacterium]
MKATISLKISGTAREVLDALHDGVRTPIEIARRVECNRVTAQRLLTKLEKENLVVKLHYGHYQVVTERVVETQRSVAKPHRGVADTLRSVAETLLIVADTHFPATECSVYATLGSQKATLGCQNLVAGAESSQNATECSQKTTLFSDPESSLKSSQNATHSSQNATDSSQNATLEADIESSLKSSQNATHSSQNATHSSQNATDSSQNTTLEDTVPISPPGDNLKLISKVKQSKVKEDFKNSSKDIFAEIDRSGEEFIKFRKTAYDHHKEKGVSPDLIDRIMYRWSRRKMCDVAGRHSLPELVSLIEAHRVILRR